MNKNEDSDNATKTTTSSVNEVVATEAPKTEPPTTAVKVTTAPPIVTTATPTTTQPLVTYDKDYGHQTASVQWDAGGYLMVNHSLFGMTLDQIKAQCGEFTFGEVEDDQGYKKIWAYNSQGNQHIAFKFNAEGKCWFIYAYDDNNCGENLVKHLMNEVDKEIRARDVQYSDITYYWFVLSDCTKYAQGYGQNLMPDGNGKIFWTDNNVFKIDYSLIGKTYNELNEALGTYMCAPIKWEYESDHIASWTYLNTAEKPWVSFYFDASGKCTDIAWDCAESQDPHLFDRLNRVFCTDFSVNNTIGTNASIACYYQVATWEDELNGKMIKQIYTVNP